MEDTTMKDYAKIALLGAVYAVTIVVTMEIATAVTNGVKSIARNRKAKKLEKVETEEG